MCLHLHLEIKCVNIFWLKLSRLKLKVGQWFIRVSLTTTAITAIAIALVWLDPNTTWHMSLAIVNHIQFSFLYICIKEKWIAGRSLLLLQIVYIGLTQWLIAALAFLWYCFVFSSSVPCTYFFISEFPYGSSIIIIWTKQVSSATATAPQLESIWTNSSVLIKFLSFLARCSNSIIANGERDFSSALFLSPPPITYWLHRD